MKPEPLPVKLELAVRVNDGEPQALGTTVLDIPLQLAGKQVSFQIGPEDIKVALVMLLESCLLEAKEDLK